MPPNTNEQRILDIIGRIKLDTTSYKKDLRDLNKSLDSALLSKGINKLPKNVQIAALQAKKKVTETLTAGDKLPDIEFPLVGLKEQDRVQKAISSNLNKEERQRFKINSLIEKSAKSQITKENKIKADIRKGLLYNAKKEKKEQDLIKQKKEKEIGLISRLAEQSSKKQIKIEQKQQSEIRKGLFKNNLIEQKEIEKRNIIEQRQRFMMSDLAEKSAKKQTAYEQSLKDSIRKGLISSEKKVHQLKINNLRQQKARLKEQDATRLKVGLSLLFTSQRIGRELTKIQQDLVNTYTQVMGQNNEFVNDINKTTAAFTFLKFSMVNAFAQSEFGQATLKLITELADKSAEFISANPEVAVKLAIGGASVKTAAELAEWATQLGVMFGALKSAKDLKKVQSTLDLLLSGNQGAVDIVSGTTKSIDLSSTISFKENPLLRLGTIIGGALLVADASKGLYEMIVDIKAGETTGFDVAGTSIKEGLQLASGLSLIGGKWVLSTTLLISSITFGIADKIGSWFGKKTMENARDITANKLSEKGYSTDISGLSGVDLVKLGGYIDELPTLTDIGVKSEEERQKEQDILEKEYQAMETFKLLTGNFGDYLNKGITIIVKDDKGNDLPYSVNE